jgi:hypothetical protein
MDERQQAEFDGSLQRAIDRHGTLPDRKAAEKALVLAVNGS